MLSNYGVDGFKFCTIKATSVDGGKTTECLVVNNADFGIFKFNFGGGDFTAEFDATCSLVKPDGTVVALTTEVAEACPAGVCHLIYEKANTYISMNDMPIIGELNTLFSGKFYCSVCTSLTTLNAPMAMELDCNSSTSLTTLNAPMATYLDCYGCALTATSIASILADAVLLPDLDIINFDFTGGTNAPIGTWSAQAVADKDKIVGDGGTVLFNS